MWALMKNNTVILVEEIDVAQVHDGDVIKTSWNKELLEKVGMNLEILHAKAIAAQYKPVLCPRCVILNENLFSPAEIKVSQ